MLLNETINNLLERLSKEEITMQEYMKQVDSLFIKHPTKHQTKRTISKQREHIGNLTVI